MTYNYKSRQCHECYNLGQKKGLINSYNNYYAGFILHSKTQRYLMVIILNLGRGKEMNDDGFNNMPF